VPTVAGNVVAMSIFARRKLQERLDSFAKVVGKRKVARVVRALNIEGTESNEKRQLESLAVAWEVLIVSAFADLGDTKYERRMSNGRRPDVFFSDHGAALVADVVTVSDDQQHKKNPVDVFSDVIKEMWRDSGLQKGSLSWSVDGVDIQQPRHVPKHPGGWGLLHLSTRMRPINRGSLIRLALPPEEYLGEYLHERLHPFFQELRTAPHKPNGLDVCEEYKQGLTVRFSLCYSPQGSSTISGHYPSYTTMSDIESHVLWRRLSEKSEQFSLAQEELPRIVFVCDGGCDALRHSWGRGPHEYRLEEMIGHFWRRPVISEDQSWSWSVEKGISGIIVLPIAEINSTWSMPAKREFRLEPKPYWNPFCSYPPNETTAGLLQKVVSMLPIPVESPDNVLRATRSGQIPSRRLGGLTMSHNRVEMSGVELLKILAGELTLDEFCADYRLPSNPFNNALMTCQLIKSVKVEPAADRDDDKITIEFGSHDAAIGPFTVPECSKPGTAPKRPPTKGSEADDRAQ